MNAGSSVSPASSPSKSSQPAGWVRLLGWLRLVAGPLAVVGFFLPWADGPGALAGTSFSGFALVGFAGRLQALDLSLLAGGTLWVARFAILGVAIAGAWLTVLAPRHHQHLAYPLSGWYVVGAGAVLVTLGVARSGLVIPPLGFVLVSVSGVCYLVSRLQSRRGEAP